MEWDATPELMAKIAATLGPVQTDLPLRDVLEQDFPKDCAQLPISGGWGESKSTAIRFVRGQFPVSKPVEFVALEYHIAQKILFEELIIFREPGHKFSHIEKNIEGQAVIAEDGRKFDHLKFKVTCWTDWHWERLKREWEENDFGRHSGFDLEAHNAKRAASQLTYFREFWFDITEVFS